MMKRNGHKIKGFTLMELMVTVGILGMIIVTIMGMFFRSFRGGTKADTIMTLDQNAQMSLSILERFVRMHNRLVLVVETVRLQAIV